MATISKIDPSLRYTHFSKESGTIASETGPKEVSNWTKIKDWAYSNKKEIFIALLITGISITMLSAGLAIGAVASASLYSPRIISWYWLRVDAVITTAGKLFIGALIALAAGTALTGYAAGSLQHMKS